MRKPFDVALVGAALVTLPGGWHDLEFHPALASTNEKARWYAAQPGPRQAAVGRVVATDHQTGGRGRLGRTWQVPDRAAIAISVIVGLGPDFEPGWVPLLAGVALARAIEAVCARAGTPVTPRLKWPNDLLLEQDADRKVSGILCELVTRPDGPVVVIGTGINVDQSRAELPVPSATSLALAGAPVAREDLVLAYLAELGRFFGPEPASDLAAGREAGSAAYRQLCSTLGRQVRVLLPGDESAEGQAVRIGRSGELVVRTTSGERSFAAGDVVHVRPGTTRLA